MTITENGNYSSKLRNEGIYLLKMTTTENRIKCNENTT